MFKDIRRRDFLQLGAAAGLSAGLAASVSAAEKSAPVRLGVIGVGSRGTHHVRLALAAGVEVPAICDINQANLNRALDIVEKARQGRRPEGYSKGPTDYRRMLQRDDLDAVLVITPMQDHAVMSIDSMRAGKHVLSEVAAAMTVDECWGLVRAAEETGQVYMLSENCCYWRHVMQIQNMVDKGVFGDLTFAECGYVHDCRFINFKGDGTLTWRGEMARDFSGNLYPTHSLGPVAKWLGINRGDRMVSLVASSTKAAGLHDYAVKRFPEGNPARQEKVKVGDSVNVLIRTAKGRLIDLRCDMFSPPPAPQHDVPRPARDEGQLRISPGRDLDRRSFKEPRVGTAGHLRRGIRPSDVGRVGQRRRGGRPRRSRLLRHPRVLQVRQGQRPHPSRRLRRGGLERDNSVVVEVDR